MQIEVLMRIVALLLIITRLVSWQKDKIAHDNHRLDMIAAPMGIAPIVFYQCFPRYMWGRGSIIDLIAIALVPIALLGMLYVIQVNHHRAGNKPGVWSYLTESPTAIFCAVFMITVTIALMVQHNTLQYVRQFFEMRN